MDEIERQTLVNTAGLAASRAKADALQEQVARLDTQVVTQQVSGLANNARDGMREQLYALEIRERELLSKYVPEHPSVVAIRKQRKSVEDILARESTQRSQATSGLNPVRQSLELRLLEEQSTIASLTAKGESLFAQRTHIMEELVSLNHHEMQIRQLERETQLLEESYATYADYLEQARIDGELQRQRISNVNVLQHATLQSKPVSPPKRLIVGIALIIVILGGIGLALAAESQDLSLKSPAEVEHELALPVLISVPYFPQHRSPVRHQKNGHESELIESSHSVSKPTAGGRAFGG
jgi:uncharacterized protein involved in exopolysaccharide biosynthesis